MVSEKRFVAEQVDVVNEDETEVWDVVFDTENTYAFMVRDTDTASDLCDLLNEQQATIEQLRQSQDVKEFSALFNQSIALQREIKDLKEENEQLIKEIKSKNKIIELYYEMVRLNE